jgi:tetrahydromethanopterin S-methyltransferase subunit C
MSDRTVQMALIVLGSVGALSVICTAVLVSVLNTSDLAERAVLASIASAAVGGVAGMVTTHQQGQSLRPSEKHDRTFADVSPRMTDPGK